MEGFWGEFEDGEGAWECEYSLSFLFLGGLVVIGVVVLTVVIEKPVVVTGLDLILTFGDYSLFGIF